MLTELALVILILRIDNRLDSNLFPSVSPGTILNKIGTLNIYLFLYYQKMWKSGTHFTHKGNFTSSERYNELRLQQTNIFIID